MNHTKEKYDSYFFSMNHTFIKYESYLRMKPRFSRDSLAKFFATIFSFCSSCRALNSLQNALNMKIYGSVFWAVVSFL
jgi:hypothetical protein